MPSPVSRSTRRSETSAPRPSFARAFVAVLAALAVAVPGPAAAFAEVRSSDRLDGKSWSELGVPRSALPDVSMKAGVLVTDDGRVLWARRSQDRRAIASITKVMTAVVAIENSEPHELVRIPRAAAEVGESTSYLKAGERLPMSELLEALLVPSGNDAAIAIATHVSGTEDAFVELMNQKAVQLGLTRTHFENAHGLDESGHYSTATDVSILVRYAMTKPEFRRVVRQKTAVIGTGGRADKVESTDMLLGNYPGANGVKTGWTSDAGFSVASSAERERIELKAIVLGTSSDLRRFKEARELLDFGFAHFRWQQLATQGSVIGEAVVTDYLDVRVPAAVSKDCSVTVFDIAGPISRSVKMVAVPAPVKAGQRVGVATFTQAGDVIATVPLVAVKDVPVPTPLQRIGIALVRAWRGLTGGERGIR